MKRFALLGATLLGGGLLLRRAVIAQLLYPPYGVPPGHHRTP